jgi:hypothetical protein
MWDSVFEKKTICARYNDYCCWCAQSVMAKGGSMLEEASTGREGWTATHSTGDDEDEAVAVAGAEEEEDAGVGFATSLATTSMDTTSHSTTAPSSLPLKMYCLG